MKHAICAALALGLASPALASPLVYEPVNPNFGGSPLNGGFLLSEANANNFQYLTNPRAINPLNALQQQQTLTQQLQQALVSALISQAASLAVNSILGTGTGTSVDHGTINIGGEIIQFNRAGGMVNITLTDPNGNQTQVSVPIPQF